MSESIMYKPAYQLVTDKHLSQFTSENKYYSNDSWKGWFESLLTEAANILIAKYSFFKVKSDITYVCNPKLWESIPSSSEDEQLILAVQFGSDSGYGLRFRIEEFLDRALKYKGFKAIADRYFVKMEFEKDIANFDRIYKYNKFKDGYEDITFVSEYLRDLVLPTAEELPKFKPQVHEIKIITLEAVKPMGYIGFGTGSETEYYVKIGDANQFSLTRPWASGEDLRGMEHISHCYGIRETLTPADIKKAKRKVLRVAGIKYKKAIDKLSLSRFVSMRDDAIKFINMLKENPRLNNKFDQSLEGLVSRYRVGGMSEVCRKQLVDYLKSSTSIPLIAERIVAFSASMDAENAKRREGAHIDYRIEFEQIRTTSEQ